MKSRGENTEAPKKSLIWRRKLGGHQGRGTRRSKACWCRLPRSSRTTVRPREKGNGSRETKHRSGEPDSLSAGKGEKKEDVEKRGGGKKKKSRPSLCGRDREASSQNCRSRRQGFRGKSKIALRGKRDPKSLIYKTTWDLGQATSPTRGKGRK